MRQVAKAIVGGISSGLLALQVALNPIADAPANVTSSEWVGVAIAVVGTAAAVYFTTNTPPSAE